MGIAVHELRGVKRHLPARANLGATFGAGACAGCEHRQGRTPARSERAAAPERFTEIEDAERLARGLA